MARVTPTDQAATAYLTRVDLDALARNLADRYGGTWDEYRARCWLVQGASPFQVTVDYFVFYSVEAPATWLEADELVSVRPTEPRPQRYRCLGQSTTEAKRSPYARRNKVA